MLTFCRLKGQSAGLLGRLDATVRARMVQTMTATYASDSDAAEDEVEELQWQLFSRRVPLSKLPTTSCSILLRLTCELRCFLLQCE